jgi:HK97 family phage portal protein
MSVLSSLNSMLPSAVVNTAFARNDIQPFGWNNGVTIYPSGNDDTFIQKGYNKNAFVHAIISKCAKKFSQIPWYHYRIKVTERKTYSEYITLTKDCFGDPKAMQEARRMRTKSIDQVRVDSDVQKFLNKPNRNQSGSQFREQLYGYKLLTGEGNHWFSREKDDMGKPDMSKPPREMFIIPKGNLALIIGVDPWDIKEYELILGGSKFINPRDNILMWKFPNYDFDVYSLSHLRGQAPLDAGLLLLQGSNEAAERLVNMNKNQGVAGLAFREDAPPMSQVTFQQAQFQRQQFNSIVNDKDLAGTIAVMNGKWGFHQFGLSTQQLQLIEQSAATMKDLCNILDVPWQLFGNADSYENRKQYKRDWIYDNIAPACYGLRDEYNAKLIPEFNLDTSRDVIDCDILSLPELAADLKEISEATKNLWQLTPNNVLELLGYDKSDDPNMDKRYVPSGYQTLEQINSEIGGNLDNDLNLLGE